jgi:transcriptional regulator with XRE-family HTH domain
MNKKQERFFTLFKQWMTHNGYSYQSAAARLECSEKHIAWIMSGEKIPNNAVIKKWLPTLLESYSGNVLELYKLFS